MKLSKKQRTILEEELKKKGTEQKYCLFFSIMVGGWVLYSLANDGFINFIPLIFLFIALFLIGKKGKEAKKIEFKLAGE